MGHISHVKDLQSGLKQHRGPQRIWLLARAMLHRLHAQVFGIEYQPSAPTSTWQHQHGKDEHLVVTWFHCKACCERISPLYVAVQLR